jgi:hypothetical protein
MRCVVRCALPFVRCLVLSVVLYFVCGPMQEELDDRKSKCVQLSGEGRIQIDFIAFLVEIIVSLE